MLNTTDKMLFLKKIFVGSTSVQDWFKIFFIHLEPKKHDVYAIFTIGSTWFNIFSTSLYINYFIIFIFFTILKIRKKLCVKNNDNSSNIY